MAYSDIDKPSDYFNTITWTGDGSSSRGLTGVGFQPDWVWLKRRDSVANQNVYDVIRGATNYLLTDTTSPEATIANRLTSFDSDGFTVGNSGNTNTSGGTYVAWNWLAGGTAVSNTDGSITSSVSASTTSGFSIVSYTANGTAGATIGHSLGAVPQVIITKNRSATSNWFMYHVGTDATAPETKYMELESTDAVQDFTVWNDTAPTSSVFTIGNAAGNNTSGNNIIAYCFAEKKGFSKFGSYVGTGSGTGGVFNYLGFKPAMVIIKASSTTGEWLIYDNKRSPFNETRLTLSADNSDAEEEVGTRKINMVSNGFEIGSSSAYTNSSGQTYIYMAFAENPFVTSTGVPATAR